MASGNLSLIHVDFPVPRGPSRNDDDDGTGSILAYIVVIYSEDFTTVKQEFRAKPAVGPGVPAGNSVAASSTAS